MIYALVQLNVSVYDRERIAQAINAFNAVILAQNVHQGTICHIMDMGDHKTYYCIWCYDRVSPSRRNGPRGSQVVEAWHFMHTTNNNCIGSQMQIGANDYLNPRLHGCYVQMGCEHAPQRTRQECQCIFGGQTYCHHASNPGQGGPCL